MNKYKFDVNIVFLNLPAYKTQATAINGFQAKQQALKEHRLLTGCSMSEMYDNEKSTFKQVDWAVQ